MVTGDHGAVMENVQQPVEVARRYGGDIVINLRCLMVGNNVRVQQLREEYAVSGNVQVLLFYDFFCHVQYNI